mgnify:CR=1 FL=1
MVKGHQQCGCIQTLENHGKYTLELKLIEVLWEIILSDEIIDDFEASMMTKLTGLFHLTGKESAQARNSAKESINKKI